MNSKTFKKIETKRYGNFFYTFFMQPENIILKVIFFLSKNLLKIFNRKVYKNRLN